VEIRVRHALGLIRPLLAGESVYVNGRRVTLRWLRSTLYQLRGQLGHRAPDPSAVDQLVHDVMVNGPESGWGLRNPIPGSPTRPCWTPYYVPSRQEGKARAWVQVARKLRSALAVVVTLALDLRPTTPHIRTETTTSGVQDAVKGLMPAWLAAVVARRCVADSPTTT
jgi:hypothetical protein